MTVSSVVNVVLTTTSGWSFLKFYHRRPKRLLSLPLGYTDD
jgi:hypothetical protein